MDFKKKYLKYKKKYLLLKNQIKQIGGNRELYKTVFDNNNPAFILRINRMILDGDAPIDYNFIVPDDALHRENITMLNLAIRNQNLEIIDHLLLGSSRAGILDINTIDLNGNTYLMNAILTDNIDILNRILRFSPRLEIRNNDGNTALILATSRNNLPIFTELVSYGDSYMEVDQDVIEPEFLDVVQDIDLPVQITTLINSFKIGGTTQLTFQTGRDFNVRWMTDVEGEYLQNCVNSDILPIADLDNPLEDICRKLDVIRERKVLIIDGENAYGEFNIETGNFYFGAVREFEQHINDNMIYEINILLLFIIYCINNDYGKLIIVCKRNDYFQNLINEYITGIITIQQWQRDISGDWHITNNPKTINIRIGGILPISVDIIHVTATGSTNVARYPKELRSYDDCLIIGLISQYRLNGVEAFFYTKDRRIVRDYLTEKKILLPFLVKINYEESFLFLPYREQLFLTDIYDVALLAEIPSFNKAGINNLTLLTYYFNFLRRA